MKLHYFTGIDHINFGDELNAWMWPKILPGFFDDNEDVMFLGIGSIIGRQRIDKREYLSGQRRIIFGAGYVAGYHEKPDLSDPDWDVFFVRGPRTAKRLKLDPARAIGDSAILLRTVFDYNRPRSAQKICFMPHWQSTERGNWEEVCAAAGITLIDPRWPVDTVLDAIMGSRFLIAEAMHGAIVADAVRVPWIALTPIVPSHREKWLDWAEALDLKLERHFLFPSSNTELRAMIPYKILRAPFKLISLSPFAKAFDSLLVKMAAKHLRVLAQKRTQLSDDRKIAEATNKMAVMVEELKAKYGKQA